MILDDKLTGLLPGIAAFHPEFLDEKSEPKAAGSVGTTASLQVFISR